jgi:pimeloyl-ACP methyl ester carboxylesterase
VESGEREGGPLVVLEAGLAASSLSWCLVQPGIAEFARVMSYDRAGYGSSDEAKHAGTALDSANDLARLLESLNVAGPVVIVGHSFGALIARVFEQRENGRAAGLVLVDPVVRAEWREPSEERAKMLARGVKLSRRGEWLARLGIVGAALGLVVRGSRRLPNLVVRAAAGKGAAVTERLAGEIRKMPRELWPVVAAHWSQPRGFRAMAKTLGSLPLSAGQVDERRGMGDLPVVVLSAGSAELMTLEEHKRDAGLSSRGEHRVLSGSGHWMHFDMPEEVVGSARQIIKTAGR